jgi:hypothetical protein
MIPDLSEHGDAGISIVQEVFAFVKRNLSGAQRSKDATHWRRKGAGKAAAAIFPASAHIAPERDQRFESGVPCWRTGRD